jgi:peptide/nickel transport system permease protein/oligopeptide transport system permease protein
MTSAASIPGLSQAAAAGAPGGWQRLKRDRTAMVALGFLIFMVVACFLGPVLLADWRNKPSEAVFMSPGGKSVFGTDGNGRDVFFRVLSGGRVSLIVGLCAAVVSLIIGTLVGMVAGFFGGKVDAFIMRVVDVLYSMPRVLFALVLIAALDEPIRSLLGGWLTAADTAGNIALKESLESILPYSRTLVLILCLGMLEWLTMARIVRGQVLVLKEQQFIAAARCLGQTRRRIMFRHLLPNLWTVILTYLTLTIPIVVLDESFLSFLGLGIEEPAASWGLLLGEGAGAINLIEPRWWLPVFPALAMTATLLALNFLGDSLRDALDVH